MVDAITALTLIVLAEATPVGVKNPAIPLKFLPSAACETSKVRNKTDFGYHGVFDRAKHSASDVLDRSGTSTDRKINQACYEVRPNSRSFFGIKA